MSKKEDKSTKKSQKTSKKEDTKKNTLRKDPVRSFEVDLWRTGLHGEEIGIKKTEEYMSKSRQFTRDMDIIGEVREKGKDTGIIGYRKSIWDDTDKLQRRLVVRLFSDKGYWQASLEERLPEEIAQSIGHGRAISHFSLLIDGYDFLVELRQITKGNFFIPREFTFNIFLEDDRAEPFVIQSKRISFGDDYNVYRGHNMKKKQKVAFIDGKFMDIGGQWNVHIYDEVLAKKKEFYRTLILFAASRRFHKDIYKKLKKYRKELPKGKIKTPQLSPEEIDLHRNPRRLSRQ